MRRHGRHGRRRPSGTSCELMRTHGRRSDRTRDRDAPRCALRRLTLSGCWPFCCSWAPASLCTPTGCDQSGTASRRANATAAVPVTAGVATTRDMPIWLSGIGSVQPINAVTVKVRVDGQLDRVAFTEGQDVHAGDVLAQIDPRPFQAQLNQALANQAKDQAQLANARLDLGRASKLATLGAGTSQNADTLKAQVAQLEATVQADQAMVDTARLNLEFCTVTSPLDGPRRHAPGRSGLHRACQRSERAGHGDADAADRGAVRAAAGRSGRGPGRPGARRAAGRGGHARWRAPSGRWPAGVHRQPGGSGKRPGAAEGEFRQRRSLAVARHIRHRAA